MHISIIIPTYNEATVITTLLRYVQQHNAGNIAQIIVADGGSTDDTVQQAKSAGATVVISPKKGRAAQMNYGATFATASTFYFLHADTFPPPQFTQIILDAVAKGYSSGCFRLSFDDPHLFLKINCWFTRFNSHYFRFGDQSLYVQASLFKKCSFNEKMIVLEDQEIVKRLQKLGKFTVLQQSVLSSARKYRTNGVYKTQAIYYYIYLLYTLGFSQQQLVNKYKALIKQDKL